MRENLAITSLVKLAVKRIMLGLITLILVSMLIFFAIELQPGDLAYVILGQYATPESVTAFRTKLGLDVPAYIRYWHWVTGFLQGNFGQSFISDREVAALIGPRLMNSLFLALYAALIAVPLAVGLGVLTALYRNSSLDRIVNLLGITTVSCPEFFLGYILIFFLAIKMNLLPSFTQISTTGSLGAFLYQAMMPALTLTLVITGHMMRMTRASILSVMSMPYIEMARLKGVRPGRIIVRHALPNALAPILNVVALNLAYLLVGVVVVEVVFAYPGLGQMLVDSVSKRDLPLVQASTLIFAATYISLNVLADVLGILSNPRLMYPR